MINTKFETVITSWGGRYSARNETTQLVSSYDDVLVYQLSAGTQGQHYCSPLFYTYMFLKKKNLSSITHNTWFWIKGIHLTILLKGEGVLPEVWPQRTARGPGQGVQILRGCRRDLLQEGLEVLQWGLQDPRRILPKTSSQKSKLKPQDPICGMATVF